MKVKIKMKLNNNKKKKKKILMIDAVLILPSEDFHRLIVIILAWKLRFLTLDRLNCCV